MNVERKGRMQKSLRSSSLSAPVNRGSVVVLVMERIKQALIRGELKAGDFLPSEAELTRNLGVGKSSVREAVKMLQAMGIVEVRRGQGTVIRDQPGENSLNTLVYQLILARGVTQDVLDFRSMFEPAYSIMAMHRATDEDYGAIQDAIDRLEAALQDRVQSARHDVAFHRAILHATRNPMVIRVGETLLEMFEAAIETSMRTLPKVALKDHKQIFKAFRAKDAAAVLAAIAESSKSWERCLTYNE